MRDKNECEKCGGYKHWMNNSCTICSLQKEISLLKKEKAVSSDIIRDEAMISRGMLNELRDKILNPVTILNHLCQDNPKALKELNKIVEYVNSIK